MSLASSVVAPDKVKSAEGNRKADLEKDRVAFYNSLAGGKDPDLATFTQYVKVARILPGSGVDTSKPGTMKIADAFKIIDPDLDGDIGRGEFDNDKLTIKLGDLIIDGANAQPPAKQQTDDKAKKKEDDKAKQEADKARQKGGADKQSKKEENKASKQSTGFKGRKFKSPPADDFFNSDPFFADD